MGALDDKGVKEALGDLGDGEIRETLGPSMTGELRVDMDALGAFHHLNKTPQQNTIQHLKRTLPSP